MDLTPAINALLSGGLQGYQAGVANNAAKEKAALDKAKAAREGAKGDAEMLDKGLRYNDKTAKYEPYAEFYTPENAISPQTNTALDQAQIAAGMGGVVAPEASPYSPISTARANAALNVMPQGDPNSLRLQRLSELKRSEHASPIAKPGDALASDEATAAYEKAMGFPEGSMRGKLPISLAGSGMSNVAGNLASTGRTNAVIAGSDARTKAQIEAQNARDEANRKSREKIAADALAAKSKGKGGPAVNKALENDYAKEYLEYAAKGGGAKAKMEVQGLRGIAEQLKAHDTGMLGGVTGLLGGAAVDVQDPKLASLRDKYSNSIKNTLRAAFGARPTNLDFVKSLEFSYNPRLSPQENANRATEFADRMDAEIQAKDAAASFYKKNGRISGFQGVPSGEQSKIVDRKGLYNKPKSVKQNGHTYILNEKTGEYE